MSKGACSSNLDDIEDILDSEDISTAHLQSNIDEESDTNELESKTSEISVCAIPPSKKKSNLTYDPNREKAVTTLPESIPGTQTIFVKTWGCAHNTSDSEYMAGLLQEYGYQIIIDEEKRDLADLWLLNSCTVKGPSQEHFVTMVRRAKSAGKYLVVAGCVPQGSKKIKELQSISVVGVQQIDRVVEVVEETLKGNNVQLYSEKKTTTKGDPNAAQVKKKKRKSGGAKLNLPKIRKNPLIEIVPINTGCLNQCTYCKTKHARGDLGSYMIEEICDRVESVAAEGVKEIWLTSEDTGAYGLDIGTNIGELCDALCTTLDKEVCASIMVRIGMTNPPYIQSHMEAVARTLNHAHIYSFLHIPVQSASNTVLDDMRRKYHCKDFETVCDYLATNVPRVHLATDIICGFPTEKEDDFDLTMELIDKYRFATLNISQFYPRPGTVAARMKKLDTKIVKNRSRRLTKFFQSYVSFGERIGECHKVLITEMAKDGWHYVGHNKCYDHFIVEPPSKSLEIDLMGRCVEVRIMSVGKYYIKSQLTEQCLQRLSKSNTIYTDLPNNGLSQSSSFVSSLLSLRLPYQSIRQLFVFSVVFVVLLAFVTKVFIAQ